MQIEIEARSGFTLGDLVKSWSHMDSMRSEVPVGIFNLLQQLDDKTKLKNSIQFWHCARQENIITAVALDHSDPILTKIVGMAQLFIHWKFSPDVGYVEDVVTDENYQRQGIGQRMMEKLIEVARYYKLTKIDLTSNPNNPKRAGAIRMYLKLGFKLISQSVEKDGTNLYRLVLEY